jgi:hypothetical protein
MIKTRGCAYVQKKILASQTVHYAVLDPMILIESTRAQRSGASDDSVSLD